MKTLELISIGATLDEKGRASFRVWAPKASGIQLKLWDSSQKSRIFPMQKEANGYWIVRVENARSGDRYAYILDEKKERPDPASHYQPEGVHQASSLVEPRYKWTDTKFAGVRLQDLIVYEMHVGAFTEEGTFEAAIPKLDYLKKLGITCVEVMPIAHFAGQRNWGYDGVNLFAVHARYGGPLAFKKWVNACHRLGLAVCLDVVYNHLGPEGNYLNDFGHYFTHQYQTPWGDALNYDDSWNEAVRNMMVQNALHWIREFHVDVLRLDAIHSIYDASAKPFLQEFTEIVRQEAKKLGRSVILIGESDLNNSKVIRDAKKGGYGFDAQWSDDFHHAAHALLTQEKMGYYADFGELLHVQKALNEGFVYDGCYSSYRKRRHGDSARDLPKYQHIVCTQNHDQVGNRAFGDRHGTLLSFEAQKLSAALLLLSPFTPLLFMGQEYGETNPFLYFADPTDAHLREAVSEGRKKEFEAFGWKDTPDPMDPQTFHASRLNWDLINKKPHHYLFKWHRDLMRFRKTTLRPFIEKGRSHCSINTKTNSLLLEYTLTRRKHLVIHFSFSDQTQELIPKSAAQILLHSDDRLYGGTWQRSRHQKERLTLKPHSTIMVLTSK